MKKTLLTELSILLLVLAIGAFSFISVKAGNNDTGITGEKPGAYQYPDFYRGIYLTVDSARNLEKLKRFVEAAKSSSINTIVMDVQSSRVRTCMVQAENVRYCIEQGIHPIARVVCFPDGLKVYPLSDEIIEDRLGAARGACEAGFREIQFDYIRFNDSGRLKHVTLAQRYELVEGILKKAGTELAKYDVRIAADIFGRIPLNRSDIIGQRMEGLDKVVDVICPMAYPSHYWTRKMQHDPYQTVFITSQRADLRTQKAEIVSYIQAFKMKMPSSMSYGTYIQEQIRAVHDANILGFILWNARQDYKVPLQAVKDFYEKRNTAGNTRDRGDVM